MMAVESRFNDSSLPLVLSKAQSSGRLCSEAGNTHRFLTADQVSAALVGCNLVELKPYTT